MADSVPHRRESHHVSDDIRCFYSQFTSDVLVGLEAGGYKHTPHREFLKSFDHQVPPQELSFG